MKKILVTGANGQLGKCLKKASEQYPNLHIDFLSREEFDIEQFSDVRSFLNTHSYDYCINTAAYTNVEKAESESEKAFEINAEAVKNLALGCQENEITLLHISTDYVFDGEIQKPYLESDKPNPINVYGASKLKGEAYIQEFCERYYIFRTSWLYSQFGHNFLNTILRYAEEGKSLTITTEQTGTPTNANDLAEFLLQVITHDKKEYGVYHYSNTGETTWYGFAKAILELSGKIKEVSLAKTDHYSTFAKRPKYSVLNSTKAHKNLNSRLIAWRESLQSVLERDNP